MRISPAIAIPAFILLGGLIFMAGRYSVTPGPVGDDNDARSSSRSSSRFQDHTSAGQKSKNTPENPEARRVANMAKLKLILSSPELVSRNAALTAHLSGLDKLELEDAGMIVGKPGSPLCRKEDVALVLSTWVKADPVKALNFVKTLANFDFKTVAIAQWASLDPDAAIHWTRENSGARDHQFSPGIIQALAPSDLARATEIFSKIPPGTDQYMAMSSLHQSLIAGEPHVARNWISSLVNEELQDLAIRYMCDELVSADPQGTFEWLIKRGTKGTESMSRLFNIWSQKDFQAALSSFEKLPAGRARISALSGLIERRADDGDFDGALAFITRYPADADSDLRHLALVRIGQRSPATALAKVTNIVAPEAVDSTHAAILQGWLFDDPDAAGAWMDANEVSDEVREIMKDRFGVTR